MTLLDQELADELNLSGPINPLGLRWTGGTERCEKNSRVIDLLLSGTHSNAKEYQLCGVRTVKELMLPYQSLDMEHMVQRYPHCRKLPIDSYDNIRPRILIGSKHAAVGLVLKSKEGTMDEPIAVKTRLGWTVYGGYNDATSSSFVHYSFHVSESDTQPDEHLHQIVKDYFALESLGISKTGSELLSTDNQRAVTLLQNLTKFTGTQYVTGLLWRYDGVRLPDNKEMALRRFFSLEKRLRKDPELAVALHQKILGKLQTKIDSDKILKEFVSADTSWTFNPPLAPHMGGGWERLIRSLKRNMMAICPSRTPSEEVLRNVFAEIENTLNSRPLTHVPVEDDASPALTPNHFLLGSSNGTKPLVSLNDSGALMKQNWRTSQALAAQFWKRWLSEYLPDITRRTKWYTDTKPISMGDIVIIVDPSLPRNCWPKGRIISTNVGRDGRIRSATVKTVSGVYERPVTKLAVLDVRRDGE
ncbi:uncharacterized protein LOC134206780 [Armigeres subalbatus]|uniref:uncharacterized protein LOC134206780 n=1 Tax=Armigeres subalbatus TaxID=124917 RepID=UPI002ECFBCB7